MEHFKRNRLSCLLKINRQQKHSGCKKYSSLEEISQQIDNSNLLSFPPQNKLCSSSDEGGNQHQHNLNNNNLNNNRYHNTNLLHHHSSTRIKEKNKDDFGAIDICLTLTSLNVISPDLRRAGHLRRRAVSWIYKSIFQSYW